MIMMIMKFMGLWMWGPTINSVSSAEIKLMARDSHGMTTVL
jgi:hypothetical protein